MPVHEEVLNAAVRICRERGTWQFRPIEIVRALPHLAPGTVRTHIVSRCCVNAPVNHLHRWPYFKRVSRAVYEICAPFRKLRRSPRPARDETPRVAERSARYASRAEAGVRDTVHAVVSRDRDGYVAECLEVAVVTQGRTLDELVTNLQEAVELHLEGEDPHLVGVTARPRLAVTYELGARRR